jgi:curved DNA-binding protein
MSTNYYDILGVEKTASEKEIKMAFRKLAHQHHPDKGGDERKFKEINEAYQTLSKADKRKQYDTFGSASTGGFGNAGGFGGAQGGFNNASYTQYADMCSRRNGTGGKIFSFKSIPGWAWIFLLPIIIVVAAIGLIFVFMWIVFSTFRVTVNK